MNGTFIFFVGLIGILILAVLTSILAYNRLVKRKNEYQNSFSQIDVQLKRRADLIPNLVESTKGYLNHEKDTLESVINARNGLNSAVQNAKSNLGNPDLMAKLGASEQALTGALSKLMLVVERYPDLKADKTVENLMEELSSTENKVGFARQFFNDSVMRYNNAREVFPTVLLASFFGFDRAAFFKLPDNTSTEAPKVSFT